MTETVLVVEDEADIMLSGEDALVFFRATPPDVTILDIGLPGIDGLEVVRRLRADPAVNAARIIVSSAHASGDVRRLTEALHCSAYLTKPFSTTELVAAVGEALESR